MTPEERLVAAAWAATQEIAESSTHRARLEEAVEIMAPAETWNELKAWRERAVPKGLKHVWMGGSEAMSPRTCAVCLQREDNMMQTMQDTPCPGQSVAPWGASADRRAAETVTLTGAKFQGPDLPVAAALASHRRSVLAAEADPFFGCTAGAPDWGGERPLAEQCATLPKRQMMEMSAAELSSTIATQWTKRYGPPMTEYIESSTESDVDKLRAQVDRMSEQYNSLLCGLHIGGRSVHAIVDENARLRAELRTMRAVINAALGE